MTQNEQPRVYQEFRDVWANADHRADAVRRFTNGSTSFIPFLLPETAVVLPGEEVLAILRERFGAVIDQALAQKHVDLDTPARSLPDTLRGTFIEYPDGSWLKRTNMVGINVRTVGSFWNIVKYALTLPAAQDSIHLLPIWEPGVVGSLYGMSSWQLNPEFYSQELATICPWLDSVERQLRAVVNLLHATGRAVGMDVIPHTDRFSEIVISHPQHFEWLQRQDSTIVSHTANLHEAVQAIIQGFVERTGPALPNETTKTDPFDPDLSEAEQLRMLFGAPEDYAGRASRRNQIIAQILRYGYEPVPATMAPPFRGIEVDPRPEARIIDINGAVWREYTTTQPTVMSRVFGPLARYKLHESFDDNAEWQLDFDQPRTATWQYVCDHYADVALRYGFDFMRGDMAHVQMRPNGVPERIDEYYDILGAVKHTVQNAGTPHFGYFAETFLGPRDVFGYGEEIDHLEAADADTTLGDLQSTTLGTPEFLQRFRFYDDIRETRSCVPAFTVMTADKDDPRFDMFYRSGGAARLFLALFLANTPSYMGLGFETRDTHLEPAPNEHYTKLYVFQETEGPKATHGPYVWGKNGPLYHTITRIKLLLDARWADMRGRTTRWLTPPDATGESPIIAWALDGEPSYVFVVNTSASKTIERVYLPFKQAALRQVFSTHAETAAPLLSWNGKQHIVPRLEPGEALVFEAE